MAVISQHGEQPGVMTPLNPISPSRFKSLQRSATLVTPKGFQNTATPSFVSQLEAMALESPEDCGLPPPPNHVPAATEVLCPFCLVMLPIQEVQNGERWRFEILCTRICITVY